MLKVFKLLLLLSISAPLVCMDDDASSTGSHEGISPVDQVVDNGQLMMCQRLFLCALLAGTQKGEQAKPALDHFLDSLRKHERNLYHDPVVLESDEVAAFEQLLRPLANDGKFSHSLTIRADRFRVKDNYWGQQSGVTIEKSLRIGTRMRENPWLRKDCRFELFTHNPYFESLNVRYVKDELWAVKRLVQDRAKEVRRAQKTKK